MSDRRPYSRTGSWAVRIRREADRREELYAEEDEDLVADAPAADRQDQGLAPRLHDVVASGGHGVDDIDPDDLVELFRPVLRLDLGGVLEHAVHEALEQALDSDAGRELVQRLVDDRIATLERRGSLRLDEPYAPKKPSHERPELTPDERLEFLRQLAARARLKKRDLSPQARERMEEQARRIGALPPEDEDE